MKGEWGPRAVAQLRETFAAHTDAERAPAMAVYMKGHFPFFGIPSPQRRALQREALRPLPKPSAEDAIAAAQALWELDEREFQYAGADILSAAAKTLGPDALEACQALITSKSWWDTVDALAAHVAGPVVLRHPGSEAVMDAWIAHPNIWLRRSALIHQLTFKDRTDTARLFRYCLLCAHENEFFIRKAIGWALRQYSWVDPEAVRAFVAENHDALSGLSRREALLHINGGRAKTV